MRISDWSSDVCSSDLWEVSLVNEMLTQMEGHDGIFIASTNQIDALDKAALRRFDIKIGFGALRPNKARELLRSEERRVGKEWSVRVDIGGRRIIKKKKHTKTTVKLTPIDNTYK